MENIKKYGKHVCWIVMVLAAAYLLWSLYRFHILPLKYYIPILVVILLIVGAVIYCILGKKANRITKILGCVFSIVLCICMLFMNVKVINKAQETVKAVSNGDIKTTEISVLVKKDSSYKDVKDLDGKQFGILKTIDRENTDFMLNRLGSQFSNEISKIEYKEFKDEMQGLLEGNTDAIIMNEGMRDAFNIIDGSFEKETRVIYTLDRKEVLKNLKANNITKDPFIVYISGIDTNGSISKTSRSDVNMLAAVNPQKKELLLVFIPRDYYVPLQCPNGSCETGAMDKLTHAGLYGVESSEAAIENLYGINIDYYVRMNFTSFMDIVDALGGVTVHSPEEFTTKIGGYQIQEGENHLNAKEALAFVRERKSFVDGDFARGRNQQRMISAIVKKVCSPAILTSFSQVLDTISQSIETNMPSDEMNALVQMQLSQMPNWDIQSYQIIGDSASMPCYSVGMNASVIIPNELSITQAREYIDQFMDNEKIETELGDLEQ